VNKLVEQFDGKHGKYVFDEVEGGLAVHVPAGQATVTEDTVTVGISMEDVFDLVAMLAKKRKVEQIQGMSAKKILGLED